MDIVKNERIVKTVRIEKAHVIRTKAQRGRRVVKYSEWKIRTYD